MTDSKMSLECVFFSLVSPDKGADLVLKAAEALPDVGFTFYGRIEKGYEEEFLSDVGRLPNTQYKGVFDSVAGDVVAELSRYDLHLLPTRGPNEGVPGVLVETKIAAVPSVVSSICYNTELVLDGVEGVVLEDCDAAALAAAITALDVDRDRLNHMKESALASAERFYIDRYIDRIAAALTEEGEAG